MSKKKKKFLLIGISMAALLLTGGTHAYFSDQISVVNKIAMGDVNIDLKEYSLESGKEVPYTQMKQIQPGDRISKIPRIVNLAEPCWIRAKIQYKSEENELEGFSDENLEGISSKWTKRGEYFYYTEIVKEKEAVDLFHQVTVPTSWDKRYENQKFALEIQAEAIQAIHFEPDFQAMSPWGNQEVECCIHEEDDRVLKSQEFVKHKIEFNGEAHKLLSISDDFFCNFGTVMPGDVLKDSASLENTTKNPAVLYFSTEELMQKPEQKALLAQLSLEIKLNDKILYQGKLLAENLQQEHKLIELQPEQKGNLEFKIMVPKELKNAYALRSTAVKWMFRVEENSENLDKPTPTPEKTEENVETSGGIEVAPVRTGDETLYRLSRYLLLLLLSGIALVTGYCKGGKKE